MQGNAVGLDRVGYCVYVGVYVGVYEGVDDGNRGRVGVGLGSMVGRSGVSVDVEITSGVCA